MKKVVFATNNKHKLDEIRKITTGRIEILSLSDINCNEDIEETGTTLEENALIKVRYIKNKYGYKKVAHIATFSTFGPKSAIRDIARLLKISNDEVDNLTKSISANCVSINNEFKTNDKFKRNYSYVSRRWL